MQAPRSRGLDVIINANNIEKPMIIPYSPRNRRVNPRDPYSRLKPLINSLSPSAKSKGARLSSATRQIKAGKVAIKVHEIGCTQNSIPDHEIKNVNTRIARVTS